MIELLVRDAREQHVELVFRVASTPARAAKLLDSNVACVLCDVSADETGRRRGIAFVDRHRPRVPILVLTDDIDLRVCAKLHQWRAITLVRRGALRNHRLLAEEIVAAARSRIPSRPRPRLTHLEQRRWLDDTIVHAFDEHGRNLARTARALDMKRTTLQSKLRKLGVR